MKNILPLPEEILLEIEDKIELERKQNKIKRKKLRRENKNKKKYIF
jgi:hypothetical protein